MNVNPQTMCVKARGSAWESDALYTGWGDDVTDIQSGYLGYRVLQEFYDRLHAAGLSGIVWLPRLSECHGPVDLAVKPETLEAIRDASIATVWNALCAGEIELEEP